MSETKPEAKQLPPLQKLGLEFGPLVVFFVVFQYYKNEPGITGLLIATAALMVALLASNVITYLLTKTISKISVFTAVLVMIMGGLTLFFGDETFIKMKPTFVNLFLGSVLIFGLWRGENYLKYIMDSLLPLTDEGWLKLARNWALFFLGMALFNEIIWRSFDTETWVWMKTFIYILINFVFMASQVPLIMRYNNETDKAVEK